MLFSNDIFASFIDYWKDKNMPRDELAADWLIRTRGVLEKDAGPLWRVMKANIQAFGSNENVSGRTHIASRETALENVEESGPAEGISGPEVQASERR